jgi:hypothetical protein
MRAFSLEEMQQSCRAHFTIRTNATNAEGDLETGNAKVDRYLAPKLTTYTFRAKFRLDLFGTQMQNCTFGASIAPATCGTQS